ncbi:MAG: ribosomal protein L7/L12 [Candidatus Hydrogenedentes bacterium]|nr:ribosomal protein L7/L12 [Candidatus Hydrogenedentota bacterium]
MIDGKIPPEAQEAIAQCIFEGRKIDAIKRYRESSGMGLKESKEFIESLEKTLREAQPERFTHAAAKGCGLVLSFFAATAFLLEWAIA